MALSPQKFREIIFLALYSLDMGEGDEDDLTSFLMEELATTKKNVKSALVLAREIQDDQDELDTLITKFSKSYDFNRIPGVERNVLRLSLFELLYKIDIPPKVVISEGMRLAKKFSSPEAATYINAILDGVYKEQTHGRTEK